MDERVETHYDILGLDPRASREQVEKAFGFCLEMYGENAMATYSLLDGEEVEAARARIREAYEVLSDPARRRDYDLSLGVTPPGSALLPFPSPAAGEDAAAAASGQPELDLPAGPVTGADLRRLRETRGVSLREIAQVSKIGIRFLEYIEGDRFPFLPAPVYLRGFLQEYAKVVGLDPRRTAEAYMARVPKRS